MGTPTGAPGASGSYGGSGYGSALYRRKARTPDAAERHTMARSVPSVRQCRPGGGCGPEMEQQVQRGFAEVILERFGEVNGGNVITTNTSFTASSVRLQSFLDNAKDGRLQLPDFQRSWVWDEERIRSLIASVSRGFPVGAVMTLRTGGEVEFKPRPLEGAPPAAASVSPEALLLDGQQRLTSLYQVLVRQEVVATLTPRRQRVKRWFYLDIEKCLDDMVDRDEAVLIMPETRRITSDFGRTVALDLSNRELEMEHMMFPLTEVLNYADWQTSFVARYNSSQDFVPRFKRLSEFNDRVLKNFTEYLVPQIELSASTSKEAVCVVFEKVNTGGKALDAFELITAMYAADGYELRKDWFGTEAIEGRHDRLRGAMRLPSASEGVLSGVGNTDFLQAISLHHTRDLRETARAEGKTGRELPQVSATRQVLLNLPLSAYKKYHQRVEDGFMAAAKFLIQLGIYRVKDLPYQSQVVPLAAILTELGTEADNPATSDKIRRWFWNGVFGELYGSSTETRIAKDFIEVVAWVHGGLEPSTVREATVRADRLDTMRMRLSAAYKGVNALLMHRGAEDFRTGQAFSHTLFFDENVDIHHIYPQDWCKKHGIQKSVYDSIINKTPLTARTNRIIGGIAPSEYLARIEGEGSASGDLDVRLRSHLVDPELLRADDFFGSFERRRAELVGLIERAIGKSVIVSWSTDPDGDYDEDPTELEALGAEAL